MKHAAIPGLLLAVSLLGCAGGPPLVALENRTFYQRDDEARGAERRMLFEQDYPPLNGSVAGAGPYVGVTVLGGSVRLSRPAGWQIRRASLTPEQRFIEYVSPHGAISMRFTNVRIRPLIRGDKCRSDTRKTPRRRARRFSARTSRSQPVKTRAASTSSGALRPANEPRT